ncbi:MAG: hypothetical protein KF872_05030 [Chitinophagales bacterium]|nr:hypothetical protein [Chitinophagales bacterium]
MRIKVIAHIVLYIFSISITWSVSSCSNTSNNKAHISSDKKIGVLLVNHGSRSETWRNALLDLEKAVRDSILSFHGVQDVKTAFMEYTEPSIATRMKEFDKAGFTDVVIVPVFLTVSSHSFDDIPTIIGQKENPESLESLKLESIERYTPKAKTYITPLLDFTDILEKNILRRYTALSKNTEKEGLVMIAYGDATYNSEWSALLDKIGMFVSATTGVASYAYGWCGHLVHYNPDSTTVAINTVLEKKENAVVIPVLVAHDEMFQIKIIGDGIAKVKDSKNKVIYKPDAILPDENVNQWILEAVAKKLKEVNT